MIEQFRDDYFWMLRNSKIYFNWVNHNPRGFATHLYEAHRSLFFDIFPINYLSNSREIIQRILDRLESQNELIDIFFKALIRSEIRFGSRYVPQRSNEERLTGNLVSEMDSAIFLVQDKFSKASEKLYSEKKEIDFFYYDLSKGGKVEKKTGADLGFIVIIDLPDYPYTIKSIVLQAKKINNNSSQLDKKQFETLEKNAKENGAYLFYDMDLDTLMAPMVLELGDYTLQEKYKAAKKKNNDSFSLSKSDILDGFPLSFFIFDKVINQDFGTSHSSFTQAFSYFSGLCKIEKELELPFFNGRLGIISIGKRINFRVANNEVFEIDVE